MLPSYIVQKRCVGVGPLIAAQAFSEPYPTDSCFNFPPLLPVAWAFKGGCYSGHSGSCRHLAVPAVRERMGCMICKWLRKSDFGLLPTYKCLR